MDKRTSKKFKLINKTTIIYKIYLQIVSIWHYDRKRKNLNDIYRMNVPLFFVSHMHLFDLELTHMIVGWIVHVDC